MRSSTVLKASIAIVLTAWASLSAVADEPGKTTLPQSKSSELDTLSPAAALGKKLFFDPILSQDRTVSCASCHKPERAFADDARVSIGVGGKSGTRNTPSAMNTAARVVLFWDGRSPSLEHQALQPIQNPVEMALPIYLLALAPLAFGLLCGAGMQWFIALRHKVAAQRLGKEVAKLKSEVAELRGQLTQAQHGLPVPANPTLPERLKLIAGLRSKS